MESRQLDVAKEAAGVAGPPGSLIKALLAYCQLSVLEEEGTRTAVEELVALERRRLIESKGVFSLNIRYRPAGMGYAGIQLENANEVAKERIRAVALVTAPIGGTLTNPDENNIYVKLGRGMTFEGAETTPSSFDLVLRRGEKVNKVRVPQGIEAIQFYSLGGFDAVLFMTAGAAEALPSF